MARVLTDAPRTFAARSGVIARSLAGTRPGLVSLSLFADLARLQNRERSIQVRAGATIAAFAVNIVAI